MKLSKITSQNRRDFNGILTCEHCNTEQKVSGYDDNHFHSNVIPNIECKSCGKKAPEDYRPLTTKYDEFQTV